MPRKQIIVETIVLLAISLTCIVEGVHLMLTPDPYALYDKVGPGGFLISISLLLIMTVIVYLYLHRRDLSKKQSKAMDAGTQTRLFRSVSIMVLFIILLYIIGLLPACIIFLFLMSRFLGVEPWLRAMMLSIVVSILIYLIFVQALNMQVPNGLLLELIISE